MKSYFNENPEEYRKKNSKPVEDEEANARNHMKMAVYRMATSNYDEFVSYVKNNKEYLIKDLSIEEKEYFRGVADGVWKKNIRNTTSNDSELFDEVFGVYIPSEPFIKGQKIKSRIEKEIDYFRRTTYEAFWNWLNLERTQD